MKLVLCVASDESVQLLAFAIFCIITVIQSIDLAMEDYSDDADAHEQSRFILYDTEAWKQLVGDFVFYCCRLSCFKKRSVAVGLKAKSARKSTTHFASTAQHVLRYKLRAMARRRRTKLATSLQNHGDDDCGYALQDEPDLILHDAASGNTTTSAGWAEVESRGNRGSFYYFNHEANGDTEDLAPDISIDSRRLSARGEKLMLVLGNTSDGLTNLVRDIEGGVNEAITNTEKEMQRSMDGVAHLAHQLQDDVNDRLAHAVGIEAPQHNADNRSAVEPSPSLPTDNAEETFPEKVLRDFTADDEWQISVSAGEKIRVNVDHGDGWVEVETENGKRGYVPSTHTTHHVHEVTLEPQLSRENAEETFAEGSFPGDVLHDFTADDESWQISVSAGEKIRVNVDHGGGWIEVTTASGLSGCIPAAYTAFL